MIRTAAAALIGVVMQHGRALALAMPSHFFDWEKSADRGESSGTRHGTMKRCRVLLTALHQIVHTTRCSRTNSSVSAAIGPHSHHASTIHDREVICEFLAEIEILLDEQDAHSPFAAQKADRVADLVDDVRLNAFGRLVEDEQLRLGEQRAARWRVAAAGRR